MGWSSSNPCDNWVQLTTADSFDLIWVNVAQIKYIDQVNNQTTLHFDQSHRITVCNPAAEIMYRLGRYGADS